MPESPWFVFRPSVLKPIRDIHSKGELAVMERRGAELLDECVDRLLTSVYVYLRSLHDLNCALVKVAASPSSSQRFYLCRQFSCCVIFIL